MRTLRFIITLLLIVLFAPPVSAAPSTEQFIGALSTCALNLKITISAHLVGSIKSLYDGYGTNGEAILEQNTDFLNLFPKSDRETAYQLYTVCVQSALDPSHFDPFILNKIVVGKTKIEFVKQRLGEPSTDERSEYEVVKGNVAVFPVGGYVFRVYYFPEGIDGQDDADDEYTGELHYSPGTIGAISVSLDPKESRKPLVLDGYWVWFGCEKDTTCATWGTHKPLGTIKLDELTSGNCQPFVTGGSVGWNLEAPKMVLSCSEMHGFVAAFACELPETISTMSDILFHMKEVADDKASGDVSGAASSQEVINFLRENLSTDPSKFEKLFWDVTGACAISEYSVSDSDVSIQALFLGAFPLDFDDLAAH